MSPRGRVYGRSSEPVDSLHVLEQYARVWSQSGTRHTAKGWFF